LLLLAGCTTQNESITKIEYFSNGQLRTWETKNRVDRYSGFINFKDNNDNEITVYGDCVIETKHKKGK
jgi:hypothetical protein